MAPSFSFGEPVSKKPTDVLKKKYKIVYTINYYKEGKEKEWIEKQGLGGTDAALLASVVRPPDGSLSVMFASIDGATGQEMVGIELFKIWMLLAKKLSDATDLQPGQKALAKQVFEAIRKAVVATKASA